MVDPGVVSEKLASDTPRIPDWSIKPGLFGGSNVPAGRLYPSLRQPVAQEPPLVAQPNHARIITYSCLLVPWKCRLGGYF
jgi:hypothetical protein